MGRADGDRGGLRGHRRGSTQPLEAEGQGDLPEGVTPDLNLWLLRALLGRWAVVLGNSTDVP